MTGRGRIRAVSLVFVRGLVHRSPASSAKVLTGAAHMSAELLPSANGMPVPDPVAHAGAGSANLSAAFLHLAFGCVGISLGKGRRDGKG